MNTLKINGKDKTFDDRFPATVADLLAELKISEATVVAEIDGEIIRRKDFAETKIHPGQSIELVRLVGGG